MLSFPCRALLAVRSQFGMLDDGARFHVIAHLIREAVDCGKLMLATSIVGRDDTSDMSSISKEPGTIQNIIQKDRVLAAVCLVTFVLLHVRDCSSSLLQLQDDKNTPESIQINFDNSSSVDSF